MRVQDGGHGEAFLCEAVEDNLRLQARVDHDGVVAPVLPDGRSWDDEREAAADLIIDTVEKYAPGFKSSVIARQIHSPLDLERKFGLMGGDIMHGNMSLDQLWSARPMLGNGAYRGPISGLYMCGAGTHPGGGVTGAPGHNAAHEILADRSFFGRLLRRA